MTEQEPWRKGRDGGVHRFQWEIRCKKCVPWYGPWHNRDDSTYGRPHDAQIIVQKHLFGESFSSTCCPILSLAILGMEPSHFLLSHSYPPPPSACSHAHVSLQLDHCPSPAPHPRCPSSCAVGHLHELVGIGTAARNGTHFQVWLQPPSTSLVLHMPYALLLMWSLPPSSPPKPAWYVI